MIKVGDTVVLNEEKAGAFGISLYNTSKIFPKVEYIVTGVREDDNPLYNSKFGGYVVLDGMDHGFVAEDFDVVTGL